MVFKSGLFHLLEITILKLLVHLEEIIFGGLIVFFLIVEPEGIARLWQILREKLRKWPFPY